ncbi:DUF397 domain-containing protein [Kitasatospora sp. NPDC059648]|uniref:DUF397 domain-containing protein n=1 Tax=Kitasatospora sp. NPDC059648 TaxID=3346894 RepID=UPI0036A8E8B8
MTHIESGSAADLTWRKSSYSGNNNNCVEIAELPGYVAVRDSKDPDGPALVFPRSAWNLFALSAGNGEFPA